MDSHPWTARNELRIPSRAAAGKQVVEELLEQLQQNDWADQDIFGVHLALEEAVVNAIKHGNKYDESKHVRVEYRISPARLWIQIEDEGPGFDPADIPDPTDDENLENPTGRGIMLMRVFMNDVGFNPRGNCVTMEKRRGED